VATDRHAITCAIHCPPGGILRQVAEQAAQEVGLDRIVTRTLHYLSGEVERQPLRVGDYFESIEVLPDELNSSLWLTFHVRQGVDSHWKYLIMAVLRSIGNRFPAISTEFPHHAT
jgi:hypothetical protein